MTVTADRAIATPANSTVDRHRRLNAALAIVDRFRHVLGGLRDADGATVRQAAVDARDALERLQGDSPRHFAKSLSQVATALHRTGYPAVGRSLLEWSRDHVYLDSYVASGLVQCCLATGDVDEAERVLHASRQAGVAHEAGYAALVHHFGQVQDFARAETIRQAAVSIGVGNDALHTTLIDAYCRAGLVECADDLFRAARQIGAAGSGCYSALIDGYAMLRNTARAEALFQEAEARGAVGVNVVHAMIRCHGMAGDLKRVDELFTYGQARRLVDPRTYTTVVRIHAGWRRLRTAQTYLEQARECRLVTEQAYVTLIAACVDAGQLRRARRLYKKARADGYSASRAQLALRHAYRHTSARRADEVPRQIGHRLPQDFNESGALGSR